MKAKLLAIYKEYMMCPLIVALAVLFIFGGGFALGSVMMSNHYADRIDVANKIIKENRNDPHTTKDTLLETRAIKEP